MIDVSILESEEYEFLRTNPSLRDNIILLGLGGSHAYGTNIETSDVDIRGVAVNSKENILLGNDFEQVVNVKTDTTIYSLDKMIPLLANGNPNTIEILGLEKADYLYISDIGQKLLDNKEMFLSKRCVGAFGGYANQQLYRLQQKSLCALSKEEYNTHTAKVLSSMIERFSDKFGISCENIRAYIDAAGELVLDLHLDGIPAENVSAMLSELNQTIQDYNTTSKRNMKAETHGKIAKHSMHLLRLYMMCIDILERHEIITKRIKEHDLLMDIRNGKYLDATGKPTSEFFDMVRDYEERFKEAAKKSDLPDNPNMERINQFRMEVNEEIVRR